MQTIANKIQNITQTLHDCIRAAPTDAPLDPLESLERLYIDQGVILVPVTQDERREGDRWVLKVLLVFHNAQNLKDFLQFPVVGIGPEPSDALYNAIATGQRAFFRVPTAGHELRAAPLISPQLVEMFTDAIDDMNGEKLCDISERYGELTMQRLWGTLNEASQKRARTAIHQYRQGPAL